MWAAGDPDIDSYYNKSHEFPLTYDSKEDPEVIEEMQVTASKLERWENNSDTEEDGNKSDESSASGGSSSENGPEEGWGDVDDEDGLAPTGGHSKSMKGANMMSVINRVHTISFCLFLHMLIWP